MTHRNRSAGALPPRSLLLCGAALVPLLLLPYLALYYDIDFPFSGFLMVPAWIIQSLALLVHESGHTLTMLFFGHPSVPMFYEAYGGGATAISPQQPWLLAALYAGAAVYGGRLYKQGRIAALQNLCCLTLLHLVMALNMLHRLLATYMGHGAELSAATFCAYACLFRGTRPATPWAAKGDAALRISGVAAGLYLIVENMLQMAQMMFGKLLRFSYSPDKGGYASTDIDLVANATGIGVPASASVIFIAGVCCLAFLGYSAGKAKAAP